MGECLVLMVYVAVSLWLQDMNKQIEQDGQME